MTKDSVIARALKRGKTNAEVLEAVRKHFPHSALTLPTINYHRNQLRRQFPQIPSEREAKRR